MARSRVDGAAWSIAGENGRSITFEDSVAYALERALTPDPQAVLLLLLDLLKFVVPEQLGAALIQEHVQGNVAGVSSPLSDRPLQPPLFGL